MWRILIYCLSILTVASLSLADTLIVAGQTQHNAAACVMEKDDILAPVLPWLRLLGSKASVHGSTVTITTPTNATLKLTAGSNTLQVDNQTVTLPVAPSQVNNQLYLPLKALSAYLGIEAVCHPDTRTVTVHPVLSVTYEQRPEGLVIQVRSPAPIQFSSGEMSDPSRAFFDFKHVALGMMEQHIPVGAGRVSRLRLSQYSAMPAVVRLVADFSEDASCKTSITDRGRQLTITVGEKQAKPVEMCPVVDLAAPIALRSIGLRGLSPKQSELAIGTDGLAKVTGEYQQQQRCLTLTFANGLNTLASDCTAGLCDAIVEKVEMTGMPEQPGATLAITFKQDVGYLIQQDSTSVRVLMGTFDLRNMVIVLDAGHGGGDVGAVGQNRTMEKTVNLDVILRAGKLLKEAGATVIYTRDDDTFIPLNDRPALANKRNADIFVSVHCNSMPKPNTASGTQTYYTTSQSARLAASMHEELVKGLGLKNGGVRTANYLVTRKSNMPAVLLELAFLNNTREEALLASSEFRQKAAVAILNGVRRYAATKAWQLRRSDIPIFDVKVTEAAP